MAEDREIYFYENTLNNLLSLLKATERGLITNLNYNLCYKDGISDFHICAQQKYYDTSESEWVYPDNEFGKINMNDSLIFNNALDGLQDQFLVVPIPISEDGILALDESFTAISLVGCLNELVNTIGSYWTKDGNSLYPTDLNNIVGIGVIPWTWNIYNNVLQIGALGSLFSSVSDGSFVTGIGNNIQAGDGYWSTESSHEGRGTLLELTDGNYYFYNTVSQVAGSVSLIELLVLDQNANLLLKNASVGTNGVGVLCLANNIAPTSHIDSCVQIYSADVTDLEESPVTDASLCLFTEKEVLLTGGMVMVGALPMEINGEVYYMMLARPE